MGEIADSMIDGVIWGSRRRRKQPAPQCKHCGATNVYWGMRSGGWALMDALHGGKHACREARPSADHFSVVPE